METAMSLAHRSAPSSCPPSAVLTLPGEIDLALADAVRSRGIQCLARAGRRSADHSEALDSISVTAWNLAAVADWLQARGYAARPSRSGAAALHAVHSGLHDGQVVRPGDVLIRDPATGRLWKG